MSERRFIDSLPVIAAALILAGKAQGPIDPDRVQEEEIRVGTQELAMDVIADEFPLTDRIFSEEGTEQEFRAPNPQQPAVAVDDSPFLPPKRRKGKKPSNQHYIASGPPPRPQFFILPPPQREQEIGIMSPINY